MDKLIITGGRPLVGEIAISGAKNAALPLMAATLLAKGKHALSNVPKLRDITTMLRLLEHLGVTVGENDGVLSLQNDRVRADDAPYDVVRTMRASVLVMGPLIGRLKHARVSLPGGCAIGARPINLHLKALETMGATVTLYEGYVEVRAEHLHGATILFDQVTVTGTENILMAATLAEGETIIENAAREPEVLELAIFLNAMGAKIAGAGTGRITVQGVDSLTPGPLHRVQPDRIEAGTFMMAALLTDGDLMLRDCPTEALEMLISRLAEAGASIEPLAHGLRIKGNGRPRPVDITTAPHPGFATDLQAQFMVLMSLCTGSARITETIFENRFMHALELARLGADIAIDGATAVVRGVMRLHGAQVMATDLRASASLVLAALAAHGETTVHRVYHLDRGYEAMEKKLQAVGATIVRVPE